MSDWTLLCDFDGTIAVDDVTDALLTRFAHPDWHAVEADWQAGRIGSRECMSRQIALLDADRHDLDAELDTLSIDPHFPDFVADARRQGMAVVVVSDGLDYAIARMLARHGLGDLPVRANRLLAIGPRAWALASPHARAGCEPASGTCKCAVASAYRRTLMVGDGRSDFCVAGRADFVFAKHRLVDHCRAARIAHCAIHDFGDARALLARLPELAAAEPRFDSNPLRVQLA